MSRYRYISLPDVPEIVYLPPQPAPQASADSKDLQGQWEPPASLPPSPPSTPPPAKFDNLLGLWGYLPPMHHGTAETGQMAEQDNLLGLWLDSEKDSQSVLHRVQIRRKAKSLSEGNNPDARAHNAVQPDTAAYVSSVAMSAADGTPGQPAQSSSNGKPHTAANATAGGAGSLGRNANC